MIVTLYAVLQYNCTSTRSSSNTQNEGHPPKPKRAHLMKVWVKMAAMGTEEGSWFPGSSAPAVRRLEGLRCSRLPLLYRPGKVLYSSTIVLSIKPMQVMVQYCTVHALCRGGVN